jgi:hypothetical protein
MKNEALRRSRRVSSNAPWYCSLRLTPEAAIGVGVVVEVVFVVDVTERIRQVVLQLIAFDLIG